MRMDSGREIDAKLRTILLEIEIDAMLKPRTVLLEIEIELLFLEGTT